MIAGWTRSSYGEPISLPPDKGLSFQLEEVSSHPFRGYIEPPHDFGFRETTLGDQGPEDHPPDLSVGTLKGSLFLVVSASPVWVLMHFFEHHPVVHEGMIPLPRIGRIKGLLHKGKDFGIPDSIPTMEKVVDKGPPYVGLEKDGRSVEGEGGNCGGGCPAYSRKGHQCLERGGEIPTERGHDRLGDFLQRECSSIVSHPLPDPQDITEGGLSE